jgi:hypothetical protein
VRKLNDHIQQVVSHSERLRVIRFVSDLILPVDTLSHVKLIGCGMTQAYVVMEEVIDGLTERDVLSMTEGAINDFERGLRIRC